MSSEKDIYSERGGLVVSVGQLEGEHYDEPREDIPGQNIQIVRRGIAHRVEKIVEELNSALSDAHIAGLRVTVSGTSMNEWRSRGTGPKLRITLWAETRYPGSSQ